MKIPKSVKDEVSRVETMKTSLEVCIMDEIAKEAKRCGLTRIELLIWENNFYRGEKKTTNAKIDTLLEVYEEEINDSGLMATWDVNLGW